MYQPDDPIEELIQQILPFIREVGSSAQAFSNIALNSIADAVNTRLGNYANPEKLTEAIKYAWNYQEHYCSSEYSLKQSIAWFRANSSPDKYGACIFVQYPQRRGDRITLHLCFVDREKKTPLLDGSFPHQIVYTPRIDKALSDALGDKKLLLLQ